MTLVHKKTHDEEVWDFFHLFLKSFINDGKSYKSIIETVIQEATDLRNGKLDFVQINREYYPMITWLSKQIKSHIPTYHEILSIMDSVNTYYGAVGKGF